MTTEAADAAKVAEPPLDLDRRKVTLTIQQWRWLAQSCRFNLEHRHRSDHITPALILVLTKLVQEVEPKLVGKKDKDELTLTPLVANLAQVVEYLTHIPGSFNVGSDLARQVRV